MGLYEAFARGSHRERQRPPDRNGGAETPESSPAADSGGGRHRGDPEESCLKES